MREYRNVRLFIRDDDRSRDIETCVKKKLRERGFNVTETDFEIGIAIGGDGTFLRMVKETSFNSECLYVGINSGTLGFLQEVKLDEIDLLIREIENGYYKIDEVGIQEITVFHKDGSSRFFSLNELVVRDMDYKAIKLDVKVQGSLLERFMGDGILITSPVGSTAHNLSYGGAIVCGALPSLQITPIAPINSKVYKSLLNSVIVPDKTEIMLESTEKKKNLLLTVDGENNVFEDVRAIRTTIDNKKIKCIRLSKYDFIEKINEKLLTD